MERGAWQAIVHRLAESDTTEANEHTNLNTVTTTYTDRSHILYPAQHGAPRMNALTGQS